MNLQYGRVCLYLTFLTFLLAMIALFASWISALSEPDRFSRNENNKNSSNLSNTLMPKGFAKELEEKSTTQHTNITYNNTRANRIKRDLNNNAEKIKEVTVDASTLVSTFGIEAASNEFAEMTLDQYRLLMFKFTQEYFQANPPTSPFDHSLAIYKQIGSISTITNELQRFSNANLSYADVDFMDPKLLSVPPSQTIILQQEQELLATLMASDKFDPLVVVREHLDMVLNGALITPRNLQADSNNNVDQKILAANYLLRKLGSLGFVVAAQDFIPKTFLFTHVNGPPNPKGTNLMTIIPGTTFGTREDKIVIVGAHWDTVATTTGYDDNASGVSAVLELARALAMGDCKPKFSIILVLFDLEEHGTQGSMAFVQDFLVPRVLKPMGFPGVQGAYILDSIMNYNVSLGSQRLSQDYHDQMPEVSSEIVRDGSKGDFIGIFSRDFDDQLSRRFRHHWDRQEQYNNKSSIAKESNKDQLIKNNEELHNAKDNQLFKLREFRLKGLDESEPDELRLVNYTNFMRSDHVRFWFSNNQDFYASFKAVLVSDTGPSRGIMNICYHKECDSQEHNKTIPFANMDFLAKVVQTLIDSVVDASEAQCKTNRLIQHLGEEKEAAYNIRERFLGNEMQNGVISTSEVYIPSMSTTTTTTTTSVSSTVTETSTTESTTSTIATTKPALKFGRPFQAHLPSISTPNNQFYFNKPSQQVSSFNIPVPGIVQKFYSYQNQLEAKPFYSGPVNHSYKKPVYQQPMNIPQMIVPPFFIPNQMVRNQPVMTYSPIDYQTSLFGGPYVSLVPSQPIMRSYYPYSFPLSFPYRTY